MQITVGEWVAEVTDERASGFTEMEATFVMCIASGMTHKEAARATGREPTTVKKCLDRAYHRLGVNRGTAAVAKAQALGWIRFCGAKVVCLLLALMLTAGTDDGMRRGGRTHRLTRRETEVQVFA